MGGAGLSGFVLSPSTKPDPMMTTNYDRIAEDYKRSKLKPWRIHGEAPLLFEMLGDVTGKSVLDLACGEGFYTRRIRDRGAGRVMGVDLSRGMIDLACQAEEQQRLGVEYRQGDARDLDLGEKFDLVVAAYLLNYAPGRDELGAMCGTIARHLRPGGRFVTVNNNPGYLGDGESMRVYGFTRAPAGKKDGDPVGWQFFEEDGSCFNILNYHLSFETHERVLEEEGLTGIQWKSPIVSSTGREEYAPGYWDGFLELAPIIGMECTAGKS